jgi:hypothetical protein
MVIRLAVTWGVTIMRIVINDDKKIPLAPHGANPRGTDSIHFAISRFILVHQKFFFKS